MVSIRPALIAATLLTFALAGCAGSKDDGKDGNGQGNGLPDAATLSTFEHAYGNSGFRVTGGLTGIATAVDATSAAQLVAVDDTDSDAVGDRGSFVLSVNATGLTVEATMRSLANAAALGVSGDLGGGVQRDVPIPAATFGDAPATNAHLILYGLADVRVDGVTAPRQPVVVAVTPGLRNADGTPATEADANDVEMHVVLPTLEVADETFLYFYFESVLEMRELSAEEDAQLIKKAPPAANVLPVAKASVMVAGVAATSGVREDETNLTVTFDASASTDSDGNISVYVWKVFEQNETGVWLESSTDTPNEKTVEFNFTSAGVKRVDLVVRDDRSGIDNDSMMFYVDQHRVLPGKDSTHAQTVSGFDSCYPSVNCFLHRITVEYGAVGGAISVTKTGSGQMVEKHIDLYAPGLRTPNPPSGESDPPTQSSGTDAALTILPESLVVAGPYDVAVWWTAGAAVTYTVDVMIAYAPVAAAPPA